MAIRDDARPILSPEIGGSTFTPGTWRSGTMTIFPGTTVTLDGQDDPNSKFLFQVATSMFVGAGCKIVLINGARVDNVLWATGTTFTSAPDVDFKGSITTGTAATLGADNVLVGSILALTAVTLGAVNQVKGCIVALNAITLGAENYITFVPEQAGPAAVIDFPTFSNADDELTIACMPLIEEAPAACAALHIQDDMEAMLNACTQDGIRMALIAAQSKSAATHAVRRELSDITPVEGSIRMLPNESGTRARTASSSLRGVGQEERGLRRRRRRKRMCHTTNPSFMTVLLCCYNKNSFSFCGSPTGDRRRELVETDGVVTSEIKDDGGISAGQVEQYLPSISLECTRQFKALATDYIDTNPAATCFAAGTDVPLLQCYAIMVTGGDDSELGESEL
jgi:hypothetical protein